MTQFLKALAAAKRFWEYQKAQKKGGVVIEITGTCNAKCYYCQVGQDNLNHVKSTKRLYFPVDDFRKTVQQLKAKGFLSKGDILTLYCWNEPLLHPDFCEIIKICGEEKCLVSFSTNMSVRPKVPDNFDAACIGNITFSMPGFSQASYDKIHQFDFERIKLNIEWMVRTFRKHGCFGFFLVRFHVYQFNVHEIELARKWARSLGIFFEPYYALINDSKKLWQYIEGEGVPYDYLMNVSRDLNMGKYLYRNVRQDCECDSMRSIFIDSDGRLFWCCFSDMSMGRLEDIKSLEQFFKMRCNSEICKKCLKTLKPGRFGYLGYFTGKNFHRRVGFFYLYQSLKTCFL